MDHVTAAESIVRDLGLDRAPIGLAFGDEAPAGVATRESGPPSACAFWREAERGVFFAPAAAHLHCPVGAMVLGFELPPETGAELETAVGAMLSCGYIAESEPAAIPTLDHASGDRASGVLYGPLAELPVAPDAALFWLTPAQAMLWNEVIGGASWSGAGENGHGVGSARLLGRPGCAAIPEALGNGGTALSLGCAGMRIFTEIAEDRLLAVAAGRRLADLADAAARIAAANATMRGYYECKLAEA